MTISLPPEIAALMTGTVTWERWIRFNGKAEPEFAAAEELTCWIEPLATQSAGGAVPKRRTEDWTVDLQYTLFFNGDDPLAQQITTFDRITLSTPFSSDKPLQPDYVQAYYGPPFDNANAWLIEVGL